MLEDVPNLFWSVGRTNGSWALRTDMIARGTAKLLAHMQSRGYTHAYPHLGDQPMTEQPAWNVGAGYVKRASHERPKTGTKRPWSEGHNYLADVVDHRFKRIGDATVFGRAADPTRIAG
jgi:hypothetical protein